MSTAFKEPLPWLYERWMEQFLPSPIPREGRATCDHCAMVPAAGPRSLPVVEFRADVKCCTYIPTIPNFLVGLALADSDPNLEFGRKTLTKRLDEGVGVSPLGLRSSASFQVLYDLVGNGVFGRTHVFTCPHFSPHEGGRCGIWRYRNSVCSTYFCKFERGARGYEFWSALRDLLRAVEEQLAFWCITELLDDHYAIEAILETRSASQNSRLTAELLGHVGPERQESMWGSWAGRESEFYQACGQHVAALTWSEALRVSGAEAVMRSRLVACAFEALRDSAVPSRLAAAADLLPTGRDKVVPIVTHSTTDPLLIRRLCTSSLTALTDATPAMPFQRSVPTVSK